MRLPTEDLHPLILTISKVNKEGDVSTHVLRGITINNLVVEVRVKA